METLSMCRICLREDIRLLSIVGTHLQEMYEFLVLMPLVTTDDRPVLVCYICRAMLKNCYELRKSCLQSEELFAQMLSCNESEQMQLQAVNNKKRLTMHNVMHLSVDHVLEMDADNVCVEVLKCEVEDEPNDNEGVSTPKESTPEVQMSSEDSTSSNLEEHDLIQDSFKKLRKVIAADITDDNKYITASVQYTCDACHQCYSSKRELEIHVHLCSDVWKKDHLRENSATAHTHTVQEPKNECKICQKHFTHKCYLIRHMRVHTGETPYPCNMCKKQFALKFNLTKHMRKHTGEKPYECHICKRRFSLKNNFTTHMFIHTDNKPYQCSSCNKKFSHKCYLKRHMLIHTGYKPHQCNVCKKQYSRNYLLTRHMRKHNE